MDAFGALEYGAVFGIAWFSGVRCAQSSGWSYFTKELYPIFLACLVWAAQWQHKHVLVCLDSIAAVQAVAALPPFSDPSISTGLITTAHQAQTALQNQGEEHLFDEGPWDGSRYGCVRFLAFECVAAWECRAAQLRTSLTS